MARSSFLRVFEVVEEPAPVLQDEEKDRRSTVRRGTEAAEGRWKWTKEGRVIST